MQHALQSPLMHWNIMTVSVVYLRKCYYVFNIYIYFLLPTVFGWWASAHTLSHVGLSFFIFPAVVRWWAFACTLSRVGPISFSSQPSSDGELQLTHSVVLDLPFFVLPALFRWWASACNRRIGLFFFSFALCLYQPLKDGELWLTSIDRLDCFFLLHSSPPMHECWDCPYQITLATLQLHPDNLDLKVFSFLPQYPCLAIPLSANYVIWPWALCVPIGTCLLTCSWTGGGHQWWRMSHRFPILCEPE